MRAGTLIGQRLDLERKALTGDPVTLADPVAFDTNSGTVSVSAAGLVAYRAGGAKRRQLAWFDRSGKALGPMGVPDENNLYIPRVSPDGRRAAVNRTVQGNADIWLLAGTRTSRFTFDAAPDRNPIWSPDGGRIVFDSDRKGHRDLYQKSSSGARAEELLVESTQNKVTSDWSADTRFILYHSIDPQTDWDLWVLPMSGANASPARSASGTARSLNDGRSQREDDGDRKPWVFLKTSFDERDGQFSPDGRWVAYMSNESGRMEIYIRPFAAPARSGAAASPAAGQWQVSTVAASIRGGVPTARSCTTSGPMAR